MGKKCYLSRLSTYQLKDPKNLSDMHGQWISTFSHFQLLGTLSKIFVMIGFFFVMDSFVENPTLEVENNLLKALESNFRLYEIEIQEFSLECVLF